MQEIIKHPSPRNAVSTNLSNETNTRLTIGQTHTCCEAVYQFSPNKQRTTILHSDQNSFWFSQSFASFLQHVSEISNGIWDKYEHRVNWRYWYASNTGSKDEASIAPHLQATKINLFRDSRLRFNQKSTLSQTRFISVNPIKSAQLSSACISRIISSYSLGFVKRPNRVYHVCLVSRNR